MSYIKDLAEPCYWRKTTRVCLALTRQTRLASRRLFFNSHQPFKQFEEYKGTDRTSRNLSALVPAACYGHIESLFVALDLEQWGTFDSATYTLELHKIAAPGDEDLLDLAAKQTILHGGTVYALKQDDMPDKAALAAIYRAEGP